jgi:hypothetical protein
MDTAALAITHTRNEGTVIADPVFIVYFNDNRWKSNPCSNHKVFK